MTVTLSETDVRTCEACWKAPVMAARVTEAGRDLLCEECAAGDYPPRVDLFPPLGIFGLSARRIEMGKHGSGSPKMPPDPGPPLPSPPPSPTPGRPPV